MLILISTVAGSFLIKYKENENAKREKIVLLGKDKLNVIDLYVFNQLMYGPYEFVSVNNVFGEYNDMKEKI